MAPTEAATTTAAIGKSPSDAMTPPKMTAISPGNTNPTNADASNAGKANTRSNATHGGSVSIASESVLTAQSPTRSRSHLPSVRALHESDVVCTTYFDAKKLSRDTTT